MTDLAEGLKRVSDVLDAAYYASQAAGFGISGLRDARDLMPSLIVRAAELESQPDSSGFTSALALATEGCFDSDDLKTIESDLRREFVIIPRKTMDKED